MPIQLNEEGSGNVLDVHVTGTLTKADYDRFVSEFEELLRLRGKLRLLFDMTGLKGWDAGALWEDVKFDVKHFGDMERLAVLGEKKWQQAITTFCKPFTTATIRYFDHANAVEARQWLGGAVPDSEKGGNAK
jgi:hypothetical protein